VREGGSERERRHKKEKTELDIEGKRESEKEGVRERGS